MLNVNPIQDEGEGMGGGGGGGFSSVTSTNLRISP